MATARRVSRCRFDTKFAGTMGNGFNCLKQKFVLSKKFDQLYCWCWFIESAIRWISLVAVSERGRAVCVLNRAQSGLYGEWSVVALVYD